MQSLAEHRSDPNLIGYGLTDCPRWDIDVARRLRYTDWVSFFRSLPAVSAGKKRYVRFLAERYRDRMGEFNHTYRQQVTSFDDLLGSTFTGLRLYEPDVRRDDEVFLGVIAHATMTPPAALSASSTPAAALRRQVQAWRPPESSADAAVSWIDIVSVQHGSGVGGQPRVLPEREYEENYFDGEAYDRLHRLTGKPIWICDHQIAYPHPEFDDTQWVTARTAKEALNLTRRFMEEAFSKPYLIGYGRCQTIDWPRPMPDGETWVKRGLYSTMGEPYSDYNQRIRELYRHLLEFLRLEP